MTAAAIPFCLLPGASEIFLRPSLRLSVRKFVIVASVALVACLTGGCAGPWAQAWAGRGDPEIEAAAADHDFPSAAEAGLASNDARSDSGKR